jgi:hypothetical protein
VEKVSLMLVLNNHGRYKDVNPEILLAKNKNISLLDIWQCCTNFYYDKNIDIYTIGNMMIKKGG